MESVATNRDAATDGEMARDRSHSDGYRPDIDGLRAVAVLAVMIYHANNAWLPGGFLGVDIFFVISGFVVTHSLAQYVGKKSSDEGVFLSFYARRAKRLLPASLFMISLVGLLIGVFVPPWAIYASRFFQSGRFALISWANNYYAGLKQSYFDTGKNTLGKNPFTHTWSLGVEEQFYFLFPLVLMLAYGVSLQTLPNAGHRFQLWPLVVLGGVSACSLLAAWSLPSDVAFFILPSRLWELASGALLFEVLSSSGSAGAHVGTLAQKAASIALQFSALLLILLSLTYCPHGAQFSLLAIVPAVCGALCFIAAGSMPDAYLNNCLSHELFVYIGKISYPLYLMHWPIMVFCMWAFGLELFRNQMICLALSLLLGAFTYHVVEAPFRAWRPSRSWIVLPVMGMGVLLVYGWLIAVEVCFWREMWIVPEYAQQPHELFSEPHVFQGLGGFQGNSSACGCRLVDTTWHKPPCAKNGEGAKLLAPCFVETPPTALQCAHGNGCKIFQESIFQESEDEKDHGDECLGGSCLMLTRQNKPKTIFLLGDSSAMSLHAGLRKATVGQFIVEDLSLGGCPFGPPGAVRQRQINSEEKNEELAVLCVEHIKKATANVINAFQSGDLVVLSNKWVLNRLTEEWFSKLSTMLDDLQKRISSHRGKILMFGPRIDLGDYGGRCVPTVFDPRAFVKCESPIEDVRKSLTWSQSMLTSIKRGKDWIQLFDYQELFCDDRTCGAFVPGTKTLAFNDAFHLTEPGSEYLAPYICDFLHVHDLIPPKAIPQSAIQTSEHIGRGYLRRSRSKLINRA